MVMRVDLGGAWRVRKMGGGEFSHGLPAVVPGDVYADLLRAGAIPDPFYRDNEKGLQWIGESVWRYARGFTVPADLLRRERVVLRCEGLDTLATVRVNGREVGRTDNMFRTWEWEVKGLLRAGANRIEVEFGSTLEYIRGREATERPLNYWGADYKAGNHAWVRKQQCNYGWDWGIKAVTCGIWRGIELVGFDARVAEVRIDQEHGEGKVTLGVRVRTEGEGRGEGRAVRVRVRREGVVIAEKEQRTPSGQARIRVGIEKPELWWPRGMGEQPLYEVEVELREGEQTVDTVTKRIGLRTLRLDRHEDEWGETFQFVANGVAFFAKGANWIPADAVQGRMTAARYRRLVEDAAAANMNMLRVWGGGIYEDEAFYDACDELGICIWQDFMFACAAYPTYDPAFAANVEAEMRDVIGRLRHRACLALWCGNNEIEQGLAGPRWVSWQMSWADYSKVFDRMLPRLVKRLDPGRDCWPGSPHSPVGDRGDFNNPRCGDAHLWDVWWARKPFEWYRTCEHRFNSEFGFQGFPEPKTVRGYTAPGDRNITSPIMEHHQRAPEGNSKIIDYLISWFRMPVGFENTLWTTQILQAMAIKYAVEHWRRSRPRGMGTLYWQLNDTWPVASWSSIDYHGRWKALHYHAARFYAPTIISGLEDAGKGTVAVHVTSDRMEAMKARASWTVTDLCGRVLLAGGKHLRAAGGADTLVTTLRLHKLLAAHGASNVLVWLDLAAGGETVSSNLVYFARPKAMALPEPGLRAAVKPAGEGFAVTVKARRCALWCWLELEGVDARMTDNFFHVRPGVPVTVGLTPERKLTAAQVREKLVVRSLVETYVEGRRR